MYSYIPEEKCTVLFRIMCDLCLLDLCLIGFLNAIVFGSIYKHLFSKSSMQYQYILPNQMLSSFVPPWTPLVVPPCLFSPSETNLWGWAEGWHLIQSHSMSLCDWDLLVQYLIYMQNFQPLYKLPYAKIKSAQMQF